MATIRLPPLRDSSKNSPSIMCAPVGMVRRVQGKRLVETRCSGGVEPIDKAAIVDGAQIVQVPRLHWPDISHGRIFPNVEVVDVLNGAGEGIGFLGQQPCPL